MQEPPKWSDFQPVEKWTATVTLYKDGERVTVLDLKQVEVIETGTGDLDPETGLPIESDHRLCVAGVIDEEQQKD